MCCVLNEKKKKNVEELVAVVYTLSAMSGRCKILLA